MAQDKKPNVLLLMADEHPVFMTGCYGHRSVKTPAIDSLAGEGVRFDAAYCPSPICAPSRAAMMTGRHVHEIEVWDNASPLRSDWPTFAHSFSAAGYHTALSGKMHFVGPDQLHGFDERWTKDIYPATFEWTRPYREGPRMNFGGQVMDSVLAAGPGRTDDMDYDDNVMVQAERGLRPLAGQDEGSPFLLCVSFTGPHYPFKAPQKYWDLYSDDDVDLPDLPEDYADGEHPYIQWIRKHGKLEGLAPDEACRAARRAVLARTSLVDEYFGRLLAILKESGQADNTIVVYTSDHGDMMGEHGLWYKNVSYEWSSRVPLIMSGPGIPGHVAAEPVSLLDLGPTLCGLAGVEPASPVTAGRDLSDLVRNERPSGDGLAIMENYGDGMWRGARMIRKGNCKLTYVSGHGPELFDLAKDPDEWNNVADDPAYEDVRRELESLVMEDWDPERCDEQRWQSEERRMATLKAEPVSDWQIEPKEPSPGQNPA